MKQLQLKPQDVVVLLKLQLSPGLMLTEIADQTCVSQGEVSEAVKRLRIAKLVFPENREVLRLSALDFLFHGVRFCFPAIKGSRAYGIPTAYSAPPLNSVMSYMKSEEIIWASEFGDLRGNSLVPLYKSVPEAAAKDPKLHEMLALVDALRMGNSREVNISRRELKIRFGQEVEEPDLRF